MTKTYSSKSNAIRAYLAANPDCGLERSELAVYLVEDHMGAGAGQWCVVRDDVDPTNDDEHGDDLPDVVTEDEEDMEAEHDVETDVPVAPIRPIKGTGAYKDVPLRRRSTEGGAVSWAWQVFSDMPAGSTRKDAIAEAVRQGIAFYTARTQYQKWLRRDAAKVEG